MLWQALQDGPYKTEEKLFEAGLWWVRQHAKHREYFGLKDCLWDREWNRSVVKKFRKDLGWSFFGESKKGYAVLYTR